MRLRHKHVMHAEVYIYRCHMYFVVSNFTVKMLNGLNDVFLLYAF